MKTYYVLAISLIVLLSFTNCTTPPAPTSPAASHTKVVAATAIPVQPTSTPLLLATSTPMPTPSATPGTPSPSPTPYPPPPEDWTAPFALGGHIRTWEHVDAMRYAGMTWAKMQVHYPNDVTDIISTAHSHGLKIQLTGLGNVDIVGQPQLLAEYPAWLAQLAAEGADAIEVWTEPNIDREWPMGQISPAAYTELLCAAYSAIKAANPDTAVISAAPAPTGYFGGCSPDGCDDIPFLEGMAEAGAGACMDYVGAHYNAGATSPMARSGHPANPRSTHHSWYFLPQMELYFDLFGGQRQLFYTEMGYASQEGVPRFADMFAWARSTTTAQQADWLVGAVNLARTSDKVYATMIWNVDFNRYGYDPQDGYAILRPDGRCPACELLHNALIRTVPPPGYDQDDALRLPWVVDEMHCILPESPPDHPDGFSFDMDGEPVMAAHSGWVVEVSEDAVLGNTILLCRDQDPVRALCSRYAHLAAYSVVEGQYIERGQEIALSGPTLFFALLKEKRAVPGIFDEMDGGLSSRSCYVSQNAR